MPMMERKRFSAAARAFLAVAAVATLGGCAMKSDIRDLQQEIASMSAQQDSLLNELRLATMSTQDTLRTQSGELFDFRGEITRLLREVREELGQLRAVAGENQRGIATLRSQIASGGGAAGPAGGQPGDPAAGGGAQEGVPGVGGGSALQLYETATQMMSRGSLTTAQRAFQQFLRENPNHERAPDAHFFLADILVQQDRPEEALEAFREIPTLFPTSPRVPDALYRVAVLQIDQGNVDEGRETLQRILNTYPDSAIALIARDKLEEIG